jgi:hypothetical protein
MVDSLVFGVPDHAPGTIIVQSIASRLTFAAREGRTVCFGRSELDTHVCVGADDPHVSREQGTLTYRQGTWWVANLGRMPMRLPGPRMLFAGEEPVPLDDGYTQMFVHGSPRREHLLEAYVVGSAGGSPTLLPEDVTRPPRVWRLNPRERLALAVLGQRYLRHEAHPQPLTWKETAAQLAEVRPGDGWTEKRVEHLVVDVRKRLNRGGVSGLTEDEVGRPVGNALNDNLLRELLMSTSLVPADLAAFDDVDDVDD